MKVFVLEHCFPYEGGTVVAVAKTRADLRDKCEEILDCDDLDIQKNQSGYRCWSVERAKSHEDAWMSDFCFITEHEVI